MSAVALNKKINKAFEKVATKLGEAYKVYRSLDYINPIQGKNLIGVSVLSYSLDERFNKQQGYDFNMYNLWFNGLGFKKGDIFVNKEENLVFTLLGNEPFATPQGILSDNLISVFRPEYSTTGGFKAKQVEIYSKIPATVLATSSSSNLGNASGTTTNLKNPVMEWDIWCWLPTGSIKPHDNILTKERNDLVITSVQPGPVGYKLHCQSVK